MAARINDSALQEFLQRPPETRPREEPRQEQAPEQNLLEVIEADLDPVICDRLPLLGRIEALIQQSTPPKPLEP
jgi:hypothetical protein